MQSQEQKFQLQWHTPDALRPYQRCLRAHSETRLQSLVRSIAAFGLDQPIVADTNGVIIKGHARREAAKRLGLAAVPVLVRTLSPRQARALRIADNKCAESDWHWKTLKTELMELAAQGMDCRTTGFASDELEALLYDDPPQVVFKEYDERIHTGELIACPHCGVALVR